MTKPAKPSSPLSLSAHYIRKLDRMSAKRMAEIRKKSSLIQNQPNMNNKSNTVYRIDTTEGDEVASYTFQQWRVARYHAVRNLTHFSSEHCKVCDRPVTPSFLVLILKLRYPAFK